ncbi:MAG: hypothetical protein LBM98_08885 [Oscillospiraceae bacterium]|jgi:hypothetical protein|nr:hypothetical protein [Oscillospiraceae bacterium]
MQSTVLDRPTTLSGRALDDALKAAMDATTKKRVKIDIDNEGRWIFDEAANPELVDWIENG